MYFLNFSMAYDRDRGLDYGLLTLNHLQDGYVQKWLVTSSTASKQKREHQHVRGGLIPQNSETKLKKYWVSLSPIDLSHNKGVAGNFYKINPYAIQTTKGANRSDIGIHLDGNVPGSLGCIVMNRYNFTEFEQYMKNLRSKGVEELPLFVQYS